MSTNRALTLGGRAANADRGCVSDCSVVNADSRSLGISRLRILAQGSSTGTVVLRDVLGARGVDLGGEREGELASVALDGGSSDRGDGHESKRQEC